MDIESLIDKEVDFDALLKNLDFSEDRLKRAATMQAKLYLKVVRIHVQTNRRKTEIETQFELLKSELSLRLRDDKELKIKTEGHLKELLMGYKSYRRKKRELDRVKEELELIDGLKEAYKQRSQMIKVIADQLQAEMSTGVRLQERVNAMEETRRRLEKKYRRY